MLQVAWDDSWCSVHPQAVVLPLSLGYARWLSVHCSHKLTSCSQSLKSRPVWWHNVGGLLVALEGHLPYIEGSHVWQVEKTEGTLTTSPTVPFPSLWDHICCEADGLLQFILSLRKWFGAGCTLSCWLIPEVTLLKSQCLMFPNPRKNDFWLFDLLRKIQLLSLLQFLPMALVLCSFQPIFSFWGQSYGRGRSVKIL